MLSRMIKALIDALEVFGWDMPLQEACWCTTLADNIPCELNVTGVTVKRELRAIGFKALGTRITLDGRCRVEIENRIDRSWAAFFSKKHLLLCHAASVVARLKLLQRLVPHTLFWCAGSWHPTQGDLRRLRSTQLAMARKIICTKRRPDEPVDEFMPRSYRLCNSFLQSAGAESWDRQAHILIARFAGHVARMQAYAPERLTIQALHWRNQHWLDIIAASNNGRQLHCRKLKVWRYERTLVQHFGKNWEEQACDRETWERHIEDHFSSG